MKILFTGGRAPATLELVRNFGRNGWEVHVADCITPVLSEFSKYTKSFHKISSPRYAEYTFVDDLIKLVNDYKINILFPTCEEIFWISKNRERISKNCDVRIICDDIEKLVILHNKYRFIEFAKSEDILTPETFIYDGKIDLDKRHIIKPAFSRFGEDVTITVGEYTKNHKQKQYILQEFIEGESVCSYGFAENGVLKFNLCYKSPFKTAKAFTAFAPFECDVIDEVAEKIVKKLNFTGNISFDFIRRGEQYYIIECNPRVTSGIHTICENDFTKMFFDRFDILLKQKSQLCIPTILTNHRFPLYKDVVFKLADIKPFIKQFSCLMIFNSIACKNKISLTNAIVCDIEWNGEGIVIAAESYN